MNILEISNLSHRFADGTLGIDCLSLTVREGEFVVIAGRNGSGKTTLLRHLNGLLLPTAGTVKVSGLSVSENLLSARQTVGMVFQDADSQIVGETVYDDAAFGPENLCLPREEIRKRVTEALDAVGLSDLADRKPYLLSGGQKRRLAIAGVLAMKSEILVFDEPFSNLDYPGIRQVLRRILALHQSGRTILLTTHDLEKVIAHASRLIIMKKGRIVRDGNPEDMLADTEQFGVRKPCASRLGMKIESWLN